MKEPRAPLILGWEEWVALPELGLPSVKAKVDTGAKTSALHAHLIEPFGPASAPMVRFAVHPIPAREDIEVTCSAPVIGRREVTSSNGEREHRYVIRTRVKIGERAWPIEVTLTNRESMSYRMLLGRQAIREDVFVDPMSSFRQPRLSYKPYRNLPRRNIHRSLRIGVLARKRDKDGFPGLAEAAAARGHVLEAIDADSLSLAFEGVEAAVMVGRSPLPRYDAVVPFLSLTNAFGPALVRQLEMTGSYAINSAEALDRLRTPLAVLQTLARVGLTAPQNRILASSTLGLDALVPGSGTGMRCLVVGGAVIASAAERKRKMRGTMRAEIHRVAVRACSALGLGMGCVEILDQEKVPYVAAVSAKPSLAEFEPAGVRAAADAIVSDIEGRVRSWVRPADVDANGDSD